MAGQIIPLRPADAVSDAVWLCRVHASRSDVDEDERREHLAAAAALEGLEGVERARRSAELAVMLAP